MQLDSASTPAYLETLKSVPGNAVIGTYDRTALQLAKSGHSEFIPIGLKDNICLQDELVTCASAMLAGYKSAYTATVVDRLMQAGYMPVARLNMDEFAMGSSNETSVYGPVDNPYDASRVPGGSSGGSAAAVAQKRLPVALGSDTGGSIRQPAAFCGVVGFKPSYGRVSRYGLVAFASSLDQIGPIGSCVADVARVYSVIAGHDPRDSTSMTDPVPPVTLETSLVGKRLAVAQSLVDNADAPIRAGFQQAVKRLTDAGAVITPVAFPIIDHAVSVYYIIASAEAASNLSRYDGIRYGHRTQTASSMQAFIAQNRQQGFGPEVKRRIMLGNYVLSSGYYDAYYKQATRVRGHIRALCQTILSDYDAIISPTTPTPPFKKNHKHTPLARYKADSATIPASLAGLPALSLNCGYTDTGLPIGFQIMGAHGQDSAVLGLSHAIEAVL